VYQAGAGWKLDSNFLLLKMTPFCGIRLERTLDVQYNVLASVGDGAFAYEVCHSEWPWKGVRTNASGDYVRPSGQRKPTGDCT
jgi:hypothetical protein